MASLARAIFSKMPRAGGMDGGESDAEEAAEGPMPQAGEAAARRFAKALEGGDPKAIYDSFKALKEECDEDTGGESTDDAESMKDAGGGDGY